MKTIGLAFAGALVAILLLASAPCSGEATDVPRGGTEISLLPGTKAFNLKLKNTTGERAHDIRITISHSNAAVEVPKITDMDYPNAVDDVVDDNNDGEIDRDNERDTKQDPASTTCRLIFVRNYLAPNGVIDLEIKLNEATPRGCLLSVVFSRRRADGEHTDMLGLATAHPGGGYCCAGFDLGAGAFLTDLPALVHQTGGPWPDTTWNISAGNQPLIGFTVCGLLPPWCSVIPLVEAGYGTATVSVAGDLDSLEGDVEIGAMGMTGVLDVDSLHFGLGARFGALCDSQPIVPFVDLSVGYAQSRLTYRDIQLLGGPWISEEVPSPIMQVVGGCYTQASVGCLYQPSPQLEFRVAATARLTCMDPQAQSAQIAGGGSISFGYRF